MGSCHEDNQEPSMSFRSDNSKGGMTFASQDTLNKLPIPELYTTADKYLASLAPLQTHSEYAETKNAVEEFLRFEGPLLQDRLKEYARGKSSYIEQFCKLIARFYEK